MAPKLVRLLAATLAPPAYCSLPYAHDVAGQNFHILPSFVLTYA